eukprot:Hpha_TRINITY_DN15619_c4_g5::TRINITY_DN15619_c4_g5_i7::g.99430::m.99430
MEDRPHSKEQCWNTKRGGKPLRVATGVPRVCGGEFKVGGVPLFVLLCLGSVSCQHNRTSSQFARKIWPKGSSTKRNSPRRGERLNSYRASLRLWGHRRLRQVRALRLRTVEKDGLVALALLVALRRQVHALLLQPLEVVELRQVLQPVVRQHSHDHSGLVHLGCHVLRSRDVQTGARPDPHTLLLRQLVAHTDRLRIGDLDRPVNTTEVHRTRDRVFPDTLHKERRRAVVLPLEVVVREARPVRVRQHHLHGALTHLLQVAPNTGDGTAGRPRRDEVRHRLARLLPDLGPKRPVVRLRVGGRVVLVDVVCARGRRLRDRQVLVVLRVVRGLPARAHDALAAVGLHGVDLLRRALRVGVDLALVPPRRARHRDRGTSVTAARRHDSLPAAARQLTLGLRRVQDVLSDTVLDRPSGVHELALGVDLHLGVGARHLHQRRVANPGNELRCLHPGCLLRGQKLCHRWQQLLLRRLPLHDTLHEVGHPLSEVDLLHVVPVRLLTELDTDPSHCLDSAFSLLNYRRHG